MKKLKFRDLLDIGITICCLIISLIVLSINQNNNYNFVFLFPIAFGILYITYFSKAFRKNITPFNLTFCILLFIRYVVMSIFTAFMGYSCGSNNVIFAETDYNIAQAIMLIEIFAVNIFLCYNAKKEKRVVEKNNKIKILDKSNIVIVIFFTIVFGITAIYYNQIKSAIYFIYPSEDVSIKYNSLNDTLQMIISLFNIAKQFFCLFFIIKCYNKYQKNNNSMYFIFSMFFSLINIFVYTGTNRAGFIMCTIATIYILGSLFTKYKKILTIVPIIIVSTILPIISSFRQTNYIDDNTDFKSIAQESNAYFGGVDNVAISIVTSNNFYKKGDLVNCTYDLFRGVLGINFLVKSFDMKLSSSYFNYIYFGNWENASQIIPIIGQGYFYFDIYGCWLIEILFIIIAIKLEKKYLSTTNIYLKYFIFIMLLRLAMIQGLSGTILGNIISFDLIVPWFIIILNDKVVFKRYKENN